MPDAAATIGVPAAAPISVPLCVLPQRAPNLDVTIPDTGLIREIPSSTLVVDVLTPVAATA